MSKNQNNKFTNKAARRFKDINKVDTMSQDEIYELLTGDLKTILGQITAFRQHKPNSAYPSYMVNAFANLSTALFFYEFVDSVLTNKKGKIKYTVLDKDEVESLRMLLADAYKKSITGQYEKQIQEYSDRNEYISKAFRRLSPKVYKLTGKIKGISKSQRRDLTIQIYGDPVYNMRYIHKTLDSSMTSDKKKLRFLKTAYGKKRFIKAVGAAMTVTGNDSDCLAMLYNYMVKKKKKKRIKYIRAYADAYKKVKSKHFRINPEFKDKNKRIIKKLVNLDIGYKKAFKGLGGNSKAKVSTKFDKDKKPKYRPM